MAICAPRRTGSGTPVSQTPCARLIPPAFSHSSVITRISACVIRSARLASDRATLLRAEKLADRPHDKLYLLGGGLRAHRQREDLTANRFGLGNSGVREPESLVF